MEIEINKVINDIFNNINPNTRSVYEFSYNQFKSYLKLKGDEDLLKINKADIVNFVDYLKRKYIKGRTIKTKLNALKAIFSDLEEFKTGFVSPFRFLTKTERKNIRITENNFSKNYITPEDYEKIITHLITKYQKTKNLTHYQNYLIISFLYTLGLRVSELINLKQHTIYDNNIRIFIINGKGGKERRLPIHPDLYSDLEEYNKIIGNTAKNIKLEELFFFVNKRRFKLNRQTIYWTIRRIGRRILDNKISPHSLRHSIAFWKLKSKEMTIQEVKEFLGHSDINITMKYYAHIKLEPEQIFKGIKSIKSIKIEKTAEKV